MSYGGGSYAGGVYGGAQPDPPIPPNPPGICLPTKATFSLYISTAVTRAYLSFATLNPYQSTASAKQCSP